MKHETTTECLSITQAARILGFHRATIYQRVRKGTIPAVRIPSEKYDTYRIPKETVAAMLRGEEPTPLK